MSDLDEPLPPEDARGDEDRGGSIRGKRDRSRSRDKERRHKKEHKRRDRSRSREKRRSRSRDRRRRSRSRSRSRDRRRRSYSRSRSRDRYRSSRRSNRDHSRSPSLDGGYRPRKRQQEPRPTGGPQPKPSSMFATNDPFAHLRSKQPMDPQEAMRLWQEQMLKSRQLVLAQQAKSAVQQANKAQRELYIGNLAAGQVTEGMLQQVFNSALIAAFPDAGRPGCEPVIKANIHSDGRYGFIEFRSAEFATAALELNGQINLMNQSLSIGRPASYVDPNKVNAAAAQAEAALTAFQAGLPLPPSAVGLPSALAPGSAGAAMAAAGNLAAGGHNAAAGVLPGVVLPGLDGLGGVLGAAGVGGAVPTPYVVVGGMISAAVLEDDEEYEEQCTPTALYLGACAAQAAYSSSGFAGVLLDLREECEKYGAVADVVVPRPAEPSRAKELWGSGNYGKAFVAFTDAVESAKARERINGRMFAGNMVTVVYVTAAEYEAAKAAPAAGGGDAAGGAAAAEDAAAGVAAVGLVTHGSPSPDRGEGADKEPEPEQQAEPEAAANGDAAENGDAAAAEGAAAAAELE